LLECVLMLQGVLECGKKQYDCFAVEHEPSLSDDSKEFTTSERPGQTE
jgi:hypothetical protein